MGIHFASNCSLQSRIGIEDRIGAAPGTAKSCGLNQARTSPVLQHHSHRSDEWAMPKAKAILSHCYSSSLHRHCQK
jgi:hypothetical protein